MLMAEYDYETDIAVQRQEAAETAADKSSYPAKAGTEVLHMHTVPAF